MAFDLAWNMRLTAPFVSDPSYAVPCLGEAYPHTYTNANGDSINAGWLVAPGNKADRSSSNDPRLAGQNQSDPPGPWPFQVDLNSGSAPGAGEYVVDIAAGDAGSGRHIAFNLYDTTTLLIDASSGGVTALLAGEFLDATAAVVSASTAWTGATALVTFATTVAKLSLDPLNSQWNQTIAHFRLTLQVTGPTYTLTMSPGSYALTGESADVKALRALTLTAGAYTVTGEPDTLSLAAKLTMAQGSYSLAGQAAGIDAGRVLALSPGAYTLTGEDVALVRSAALPLTTGHYALTGSKATLKWSGEPPDTQGIASIGLPSPVMSRGR